MRERRLIPRILVAALVVAGLTVVWLNKAMLDPAGLQALIAGQPLAPLVFVAVHIVASQVFVPRTLFGVVAGLVFGLWWGGVLAILGGMGGALVGFLIARYVNAGLLDVERTPALGTLLLRAERGGWRFVALVRLVPILPHTLVNYALGMTRVPLGSYLVGSLLGMLPMTVLYVDLGAGGGRVLTGQRGWLEPTLIAVVALGASVLLPRLPFFRRDKAAPAGSPTR
ncbi:MAG TPA: TVP38/TMEM64 family protein [Stellaceae bacterium]|nr:TVP38/TMEM64 family protein [Stellaceae bacterium]